MNEAVLEEADENHKLIREFRCRAMGIDIIPGWLLIVV